MIMYRAKVEQINGVNVRAGGKWLKCIGNKIVNVGDYVWTDGRCVYGYEQESMTPLVITNNPDELGIPILISSYKNTTGVTIFNYDIKHNELVQIGRVKRNLYRSIAIINKKRLIHVVNKNSWEGESKYDNRIFADKIGDVYVVRQNKERYSIEKNGVEIESFNEDSYLLAAMVISENDWWIMCGIKPQKGYYTEHIYRKQGNIKSTVTLGSPLPLTENCTLVHNNIQRSPNLLAYDWADNTIYSPNDKPLFKIFAPVTISVSVCKITPVKFLIAYRYSNWGPFSHYDYAKTGNGLLVAEEEKEPQYLFQIEDVITEGSAVLNGSLNKINNYKRINYENVIHL